MASGDTTPETQTAVARGTSAVATLTPSMRPRKLAGVTLTGPAGSRAKLYLGSLSPSARFDETSRGSSNSADYATPRSVPAGMSVLVEWLSMSARASECSATFTMMES